MSKGTCWLFSIPTAAAGAPIKGIQIGKEVVKLLLFADDMILNTETPKDATRKLLELINEFDQIAG